MLDIDLMTQQQASLKQIESKNYYKTASYSVIRPLQLGAILNKNSNSDTLDLYKKLGTDVGIGYQIQDDYLNLFYPEETTGKKQYTDISMSQNTIFKHHILTNFSPKIIQEYLHLEGKPLSPEIINNIKNLLEKTGLRGFGQKSFNKHYQSAEETLANSSLDDKINQALSKLLVTLRNRTH